MDVLPVVDVGSGRVVESVGLPLPGGGPASVVAVGNGFVLVTLERAGVVAVVDLLEHSVTRLIPVGGGPRGLAADPADLTGCTSPSRVNGRWQCALGRSGPVQRGRHPAVRGHRRRCRPERRDGDPHRPPPAGIRLTTRQETAPRTAPAVRKWQTDNPQEDMGTWRTG